MRCPHGCGTAPSFVYRDVRFPACCYSVAYIERTGFEAAWAELTRLDPFEFQIG